ncbi:MAG: RloB domain-containing protein [Oscillospiraceae bacterium]
MARNVCRKLKPLIYVFYEGKSEQAYVEFLKEQFQDTAVIKARQSEGLFEFARDKFKNDIHYKSNAEVVDEIWFFFDVESKDIDKWDKRFKIVQSLRKLRKPQNIKVRLLMTTACMEYWLMLHYEKLSPTIADTAEKEKMLNKVKLKVPSYKKGDYNATAQIAKLYKAAIENGKWTLHCLQSDGLPTLNDTDFRNEWLYKSNRTFTTVHEALEFLEQL